MSFSHTKLIAAHLGLSNAGGHVLTNAGFYSYIILTWTQKEYVSPTTYTHTHTHNKQNRRAQKMGYWEKRYKSLYSLQSIRVKPRAELSVERRGGKRVGRREERKDLGEASWRIQKKRAN